MSETRCVIAVDVGNSAAKLCCRVRGAEAPADSVGPRESLAEIVLPIDRTESSEENAAAGTPSREDANDWIERAIGWASEQAGCDVGRTQWRIASVQRFASRRLCERLQSVNACCGDNDLSERKSADCPDVRSITHQDVPMTVCVDHPERLGIDRLVGAFAATQMFNPPLVVVDAGSAVTVDWIDGRGCFCGGAILPGVRLQLKSLARETDALPQIDLSSNRQPSQPSSSQSMPLTPGKNTDAAIRLGVITSVAAAIDRLAESYHRLGVEGGVSEGSVSEGGDAEPIPRVGVIVTGGDASLISGSLRVPHTVVSQLVCRGLLELSLGSDGQ